MTTLLFIAAVGAKAAITMIYSGICLAIGFTIGKAIIIKIGDRFRLSSICAQ